MSSHCHSVVAQNAASHKTFSVRTVLIEEDIDLVATVTLPAGAEKWQYDSTLEEAFKKARLSVSLGSTSFCGSAASFGLLGSFHNSEWTLFWAFFFRNGFFGMFGIPNVRSRE